MKTKNVIIILVLFVITNINCRKVKTNNPIDYKVRWNNMVFGAFVNGVPYTADYSDPGYGVGPVNIDFWASGTPPYSNFYTTISGLKDTEEIGIYLPNELRVGRYELNNDPNPFSSNRDTFAYGSYDKFYQNKYYRTTSTVTGYVNVTKADRNPRKVEGTFQFEAINKQTNEKVRITNGYFSKNL